jgi:anti-anti-sigma factor
VSEDFTREVVGEILIEKVNLDKATLKEAVAFKERLLNDSAAGYNKIIVDLSKCSYVDSSIVGALVVSLKKVKTSGGELKVVIPKSDSFQAFTSTGLARMFNLYNRLDEAILSFGNN